MTRKKRSRIGTAFKNIIAFLFLLLSLLVVVGFAAVFFMPDLLDNTPLGPVFDRGNSPTAVPPTKVVVAVLPSSTPTETPNPLLPTWTPIGAQPTLEMQATNTRRATATPTIVPTFPSRTPTPTSTPTPTDTATATPIGPTATPAPTKSAFPFTKSNTSPFYLQNYANNAGCNWLGIAGEVLDLSRNPVPKNSYVVHVWGSGIDERLLVGSAPTYSPSGWEQFVFDAPAVRDFNLQLETSSGTAVSQVYTVQTRASCNENLLRFDFVQNH